MIDVCTVLLCLSRLSCLPSTFAICCHFKVAERIVRSQSFLCPLPLSLSLLLVLSALVSLPSRHLSAVQMSYLFLHTIIPPITTIITIIDYDGSSGSIVQPSIVGWQANSCTHLNGFQALVRTTSTAKLKPTIDSFTPRNIFLTKSKAVLETIAKQLQLLRRN
jgi:hypothetical protein